MRLQFERSGGVAGMRLGTVIDSSELTPDESTRLEEIVKNSGFFDLPPELPKSPGADRFQYTVTIETPDRRHTVRMDDGAAPVPLRPLLDWATTAARKKRTSA